MANGESVTYTAEVFDIFGENGSVSVPDYSLFEVHFQPPLPSGALSEAFIDEIVPWGGSFEHRISTAHRSAWRLEIQASPEEDTLEDYDPTDPRRVGGRQRRLEAARVFVSTLLESVNAIENPTSDHGTRVNL